MTAKSKAIELWSSYRAFLSLPGAPLGDMKDEIAKDCALHTVAGIQQALDEVDEFEVQNLDRVHAWWNNVEEEIKKL